MRRLGRLIVLLFLSSATAHGHPGPVDRYGGHTDLFSGIYHMHAVAVYTTKTSASSVARDMRRIAEIQERARVIANNHVRSFARQEARTIAREESIAKRKQSAPEPKEVRYLFHHREDSPFEVFSFADDRDHWRVVLAKGLAVKLKKADIVRIEAEENLKDFRTWIDTTGRFSTVAKFMNSDDTTVRLETLEEEVLEVPTARLSPYDQKHLSKIQKGKKDAATAAD